jgi:hypothetical protein
MYSYVPHSAEDAKENVIAFAGRVQGGDFKWEFTDADDSSYEINSGLKAAVNNYKGTLVSTNVGNSSSSDNGGSTEGGDNGNEDGNEGGSTVTPTPEGTIVHNFTDDGKESSFFSITGNLSTSKGTVTCDGKTLTRCLKMESSTNITFTISEARTLILVFVEDTTNVKIDGEKITSDSNIITVELEAGTHTITKADTKNLFYIVLSK